jgi:hypothetical protein
MRQLPARLADEEFELGFKLAGNLLPLCDQARQANNNDHQRRQ